MSQEFLNFRAVPYVGLIPQPRAVGLCAGVPANVVPIIFNWGDYAPDDVIEINLQMGGNVKPPLSAIRSVIVDNTFSQGSVQVRFPDTGFVVQCEQDASTSGIVLTNNLQIQVRREITGLSVFTQTTVFLCDFIVDTYTQERLSPTLQLWRGSQSLPFRPDPSYSPPTLGQRSAHAVIDLGLTGHGNGAVIFDTAADWQIILKSYTVMVAGNYSAGISPLPGQLRLGGFFAPFPLQWSWYARNSLEDYNLHLDTQDGLGLDLGRAAIGLGQVRFYNSLAIPGATGIFICTYDTIDGEFVF